jgi:hypothetical protein
VRLKLKRHRWLCTLAMLKDLLKNPKIANSKQVRYWTSLDHSG